MIDAAFEGYNHLGYDLIEKTISLALIIGGYRMEIKWLHKRILKRAVRDGPESLTSLLNIERL